MSRIRARGNPEEMTSGKFPLVPEGDYVVKVERSEGGLTKDGTRHKADLFLSIHDQASNAGLGWLWNTITFIPEGEKGHGMWLHANKCLDMPYDGDVVIETDDYIGKSSLAHVVIDEYQGKKRNKIAYFIWPEEDSQVPPEPPKGKANLKARGKPLPPLPKGKPKSANADDLVDEVPF